MPLANRFLRRTELTSPEPKYPLEVFLCRNCSLVQLLEIVSPKQLFQSYAYLTGISNEMISHFADLAHELSPLLPEKKRPFVVDIGSNDGSLLREFSRLSYHVLGVEPASNVARIATKRGVTTVNAFFNAETARKVEKNRGKAEVITCTNVFAHIDDLDSFVEAIRSLLATGGVLVVEVPYLVDMLSRNEFDTIYHEHLSYFRVEPLNRLFDSHGMRLIDAKKVNVHGGSIRLLVTKEENRAEPHRRVRTLLKKEERLGLSSLAPYARFARSSIRTRERLELMLAELKERRMRIAGYGAAAKGNTLLNWCRIGPETVEYIADDTPLKQGLFSPGMRIPIVSTRRISLDKPDYVLVLAWNWFHEIAKKEQKYIDNGGKFIVPVPEPRILTKASR